MVRFPRSLRLSFTVVVVVLLFAAWTEATRPVRGPHGRLALSLYRSGLDSLPVLQSLYFSTAGRCAGCHGHDLLGQASMDPATGHDVNVVGDWRSTMMANSARDPYFQAKLDHEVLVNPAHHDVLSNKCLSCHAPLAVHEARMAGHPPFTLAMLDTSILAQDGVSCMSCHAQSPTTAGLAFNGEMGFDSARIYGPYHEDQINPNIMQFFVGLTPGYGEHIVNSTVCAGCHTLITQTVDLSGNPTGDEFVEQATYHEWKNSVYSTNETHCNTCHMPRIDGPVVLAAEYAFLNPQTPFGLHHLVGGNVQMLEILKANRELLAIPATEAQFDSTIARTHALLTQRTLDLTIALEDRSTDTAFFAVRLENRAGHRFPSGAPARRAFVRFVVRNAAGDTLFVSGALDAEHEVIGHDTGYEPHHDVIHDPGQVQIYELVMGDVTGNATTILERAKEPLKDNRLVPLGFTTTHPSYDTTRLAGHVLDDPDFNRSLLNEEGSGTDVIHYHVALNGDHSALTATAEVFFQAVPPGSIREMLTHHSERIDRFRTMMQLSDATPIRVAVDSMALGPLGVPLQDRHRIVVLPNPTPDGVVEIRHAREDRVEFAAAFDVRGQAVAVSPTHTTGLLRLHLPTTPGMYLVHLRVNGTSLLQRIVRR